MCSATSTTYAREPAGRASAWILYGQDDPSRVTEIAFLSALRCLVLMRCGQKASLRTQGRRVSPHEIKINHSAGTQLLEEPKTVHRLHCISSAAAGYDLHCAIKLPQPHSRPAHARIRRLPSPSSSTGQCALPAAEGRQKQRYPRAASITFVCLFQIRKVYSHCARLTHQADTPRRRLAAEVECRSMD